VEKLACQGDFNLQAVQYSTPVYTTIGGHLARRIFLSEGCPWPVAHPLPRKPHAKRGATHSKAEFTPPGAYRPVLALGIMSEADLETMHRAYMETDASPDKYALFVSLMVCGKRRCKVGRGPRCPGSARFSRASTSRCSP
jgi:hypothetical protein